MEKRRNCSLGAISPLFHNILSVVRFSCLKGTGFSLRDKRLFEISEVKITGVDCMTEFPSMNMYPMHINERENPDQTMWLCMVTHVFLISNWQRHGLVVWNMHIDLHHIYTMNKSVLHKHYAQGRI